MPYRNISDDLGHASIRLYNRQILPMTDILDAVGFSRPTFFRILKQHRETGHVSKPRSLRRSRPRALNYSDVHYLLELVKQRPDWFLDGKMWGEKIPQHRGYQSLEVSGIVFSVAAMIQNSSKSFFDLCFLTRDVVSSFSQTAVTARRHDNFEVTIRWAPGHPDVHGNEEADKQAKLAAESRRNNSLPPELLHYLRHGALPSASQRSRKYIARRRMSDGNLLQCSFVKLTASFPKRLTSLYMSLRMGHALLNKHLHRIGKTESPHCQRTEETVHHFLFTCPFYQRERHILVNALGRKASSPSHIFSLTPTPLHTLYDTLMPAVD
ncbi:hypothetical protein AZE42_10561 [Rhizopogon vesiculosus]|uniref:RNase H type-1 domain-containing protein n=1 Tax=Rhizopogon vesiculosus TaxID=180088 RepID=A0A1J8PQN8_9AGAM|nr:hypothetical protein AZE42_10561 [Rhizopogon vesiculosus]